MNRTTPAPLFTVLSVAQPA